jgi:hypothetical protein
MNILLFLIMRGARKRESRGSSLAGLGVSPMLFPLSQRGLLRLHYVHCSNKHTIVTRRGNVNNGYQNSLIGAITIWIVKIKFGTYLAWFYRTNLTITIGDRSTDSTLFDPHRAERLRCKRLPSRQAASSPSLYVGNPVCMVSEVRLLVVAPSESMPHR